MSVVRISGQKFDSLTEFMLREGIPLTLKNWLELNYWRDVKLSELDPKVVAEIPRYLLPGDEPTRKAKVVTFKAQHSIGRNRMI